MVYHGRFNCWAKPNGCFFGLVGPRTWLSKLQSRSIWWLGPPQCEETQLSHAMIHLWIILEKVVVIIILFCLLLLLGNDRELDAHRNRLLSLPSMDDLVNLWPLGWNRLGLKIWMGRKILGFQVYKTKPLCSYITMPTCLTHDWKNLLVAWCCQALRRGDGIELCNLKVGPALLRCLLMGVARGKCEMVIWHLGYDLGSFSLRNAIWNSILAKYNTTTT